MSELSGLISEYLAFREARGFQPNRKLERLLSQFADVPAPGPSRRPTVHPGRGAGLGARARPGRLRRGWPTGCPRSEGSRSISPGPACRSACRGPGKAPAAPGGPRRICSPTPTSKP